MRLFGIISILFLACSAAVAEEKPEIWLYCPTNLQVKENIEKLQELWKRAADAGYTHVLLADSKFAKLYDDPDFYFENCRKVKQMAADLKLQIVPALFSVGYSNDLLWKDPNLAEGLPVKDSLFVVQGWRGPPAGRSAGEVR